tara:strand:+ start:83 stop:820 length:738 start_codon:yes stop_codon:yes gene_type:complete
MSEEQATPTESATDTPTETSVPPTTTESVAEPTRPEGLPEKFGSWEDMAKSYSELESWKGKKEEDIKANVLQELETEAYANRPASAGDYQIPEILDEGEAATNPLLKWWADYSWDNGLSQDEFNEGITKWAEHNTSDEPDLEEVKKDLGDNANQRVEAVQLFMNKFFPEEMQDAVALLGTSAEGIKALELIQRSMQQAQPNNQATTPAKQTIEDLMSKMKDPRYYDPARRDQAYVQEITNGFKTL